MVLGLRSHPLFPPTPSATTKVLAFSLVPLPLVLRPYTPQLLPSPLHLLSLSPFSALSRYLLLIALRPRRPPQVRAAVVLEVLSIEPCLSLIFIGKLSPADASSLVSYLFSDQFPPFRLVSHPACVTLQFARKSPK